MQFSFSVECPQCGNRDLTHVASSRAAGVLCREVSALVHCRRCRREWFLQLSLSVPVDDRADRELDELCTARAVTFRAVALHLTDDVEDDSDVQYSFDETAAFAPLVREVTELAFDRQYRRRKGRAA